MSTPKIDTAKTNAPERIDVYGTDGKLFSSFKSPEKVIGWLLKTLPTVTPEQFEVFVNANENSVESLPMELANKFYTKVNELEAELVDSNPETVGEVEPADSEVDTQNQSEEIAEEEAVVDEKPEPEPEPEPEPKPVTRATKPKAAAKTTPKTTPKPEPKAEVTTPAPEPEMNPETEAEAPWTGEVDGTEDDESSTEADEIKAADFVRIGQRRTNQALKQLSLMRNLANRNSYVSTPEQHQVIIMALRAEVDKLEEAFKTGGKNDATTIEL